MITEYWSKKFQNRAKSVGVTIEPQTFNERPLSCHSHIYKEDEEKIVNFKEEINTFKLRYDFIFKNQVEQLANDYNQEMFKQKIKDKVLNKKSKDMKKIKV